MDQTMTAPSQASQEPHVTGQCCRLVKSMASAEVTHSSILALETPWTEEPGGLQSTGSQKSRTQLNDKTRPWFS